MFISCSYVVPVRQNLPGQSGGGSGGDTTSFIMEIDTNISGHTPNNQFRLYSSGNTGRPYTVDWGDGSSDVDTNSNDITHTYASPGVYDISITYPYNRIWVAATNDKNKIKKIKQWGNLPWVNMASSFSRSGNMNITAIDVGDFSNVTSWSQAFRNTPSLTSLGNYSNWVTSNCTNMSLMLYATGLSGTLDFTGWDTSNVTNISYLISTNPGLTSIDTTGWDVSKVTTFFNFASACANLDTIIGHENWDTSSATNFANFLYNTKLTQFDPSNWDVSKVTTFSQAFRNALNNVGSIDLSNWTINTNSNVNMSLMMSFNNQLTSVGDISSWDVSRVTNLSYLGANCSVLQLPNLSSWDTGNVTTLRNAFSGMGTNASVSGIENWDTSSLVGSGAMQCFYLCRALNTTAINWDLRNCNNIYQLFRQADFQNGSFTMNIQTSSTLTNASQLFYAASSFNSITIGNNVDFSNVTNFSYAFGQMGSLSLTLPANFSFASGTNFTQFLTGTTLSSSDYNTLLIYIEASNQNNNINFDAQFCVATGAGLTARNALINDHGWTINDNS